MERVFLDTNIILDLLAQREPFFDAAQRLFRLGEEKKVLLLISTMSYITTEYILRKQMGKPEALKALEGLRKISQVGSSGEKEIDLSLVSSFKDFEDAFQYYTALKNEARVLVTRNFKDFAHSQIPVMSAESYVKSFSEGTYLV